MIAKYDIDGNAQWGLAVNKIIRSMKEIDGIIYAGGKNTLMKLSSNGDILMNQTISGTVYSIKPRYDGGYIAVGEKLFGNGETLVVYNENDEKVLTLKEGSTANDVFEGNDGKILTALSNGQIRVYDDKGNLEKTESIMNQCWSISSSPFGGIVIAGVKNSKAAYVKVSGGGSIIEQSEIEAYNVRKEFKITTDVQEINGVKGGAITGEDLEPYEIVKYGDDSEKEIKMTPNPDYKIIAISINGENYPFEENEDGTYTLPQLSNITENKHIVVTYAYKSNILTLNKVDENTGESLSGVKFRIDTGAPELITSGNYGFVCAEEKYIPTNSKKYQVSKGGISGISSTTANSYIEIDLKNKQGNYKVVINASVSSDGRDYGYATISDKRISPAYDDSAGRFMYITGSVSNSNYTSATLVGGKKYFLHLGYYKDIGTDGGNDQVVFNSIKLLDSSNNEVMNLMNTFISNVETNSSGKSYLQLKYGKEYYITETETLEGYDLLKEPVVIQFSSTSEHEITIQNKKKAIIKVHHYIKDTETPVADDEEYTDSVGNRYTTTPHLDLEQYVLEKDEQDKYVLPDNATGIYTAEEQEIIYYYVEKTIPLTVHYYIEGTEEKVPLKDGTLAEDGKGSGHEGEEYTTDSVSEELLDDSYELVEIPENADGTYGTDEVVVNYYYKKVKRNITVVKVDEEDNEYQLRGAEFVFVKDGETSEVYTTNERGKFTVELEAGEYELKEITPPTNYKLPTENSTMITVSKDSESFEYTVTNERIKGNVLVHHFVEGTETRVPSNDGGVVEDEIRRGLMGEIYATKESDEINPMYEFVSVEGETSGEFGEEEKVIIYYYKFNSPSLESSIEKEAQAELVVDENDIEYPLITKEDEQITYTIRYNVSIEDYKGRANIKIEDILPSYIDLGKSDIQDGTYSQANHTITWNEIIDVDTFENGKYETEIEKVIKVSYLSQKTNEDLRNIVKGSTIIYYPDTHPEIDELEGPGKVLLLDTEEDEAVVKQEYKVRLQVKKIWNDNDNEREHRPESITVTIKSNNNIYKEIVLNDGNEWSYEDFDLPKYDESGIEIDYTVEEKETNEKDLAFYRDVDIKKVKIQDKYETTNIFEIINGLSMDTKLTKTGPEKITKSAEAMNYEIHLNSIVTNYRATGKVKIVDTLPYKIDVEKSFLDGGIYDEATNTITWEDDVSYLYDGEEAETGTEEEPIDSTPIDDNEDSESQDNQDNNENIEIPETNNVSDGTISDTDNDISNDVTNEVLPDENDGETTNATTGENDDSDNATNNINRNLVPVGAPRETDNVYKLDISKYITIVYKDIVFTDETIQNKVRAEIEIGDLELMDTAEDDTETEMEIPGKVIVKYVDEATGEELAKKEIIEGLAGNPYTTEEKEFENYELKEVPENAEGEIPEGTTEVIYYYRYYAKVIVKYLEQNTNKVLAEEILIEGRVGDNYATSVKSIEHFNFTFSTTNTSGKMTRKPIEVIYYYEWPHSEEPEPIQDTPKPEEKRSVVNRIVHPTTGDPVPVIAYSIIVLTIGINVMLLQFNTKELVRVNKIARVSRMDKILQSDRNKTGRTKKARREK